MLQIGEGVIMFKIKLVANNEVIIDNTLSEDAVKSIAEVDDVNALSNDVFANIKLNNKCIEFAKQIMNNHGVEHAKLYITNSYFEEPTHEDFDL